MTRNEKRTAFLNAAYTITGGEPLISRTQALEAARVAGLPNPAWLTNDPAYRAGRGYYRLPPNETATTVEAPVAPVVAPVTRVTTPAPAAVGSLVDMALSMQAIESGGSAVPSKDPLFVPYGEHDTIVTIIRSGRWAPSYVVGPSGCGKTFSYQQACAELNREYYEVQITAETTEDDLLGGFRLVAGETKFVYGPVALAMLRGGFLVLDEIDQATSKVMCLQQVLNGKPVFLKKINQWVKPATGFNVGATANTKGNGDETGRFVGANPLNVAFRDRLSGMTFIADYPAAVTERKILDKAMKAVGLSDEEFGKRLVEWAGVIRKTNREGGLEETITTRRLVQIAQNLAILGSRVKAVELGTNIYDEVTREAMLNLYKKVDDEAEPKVTGQENLGKAPTGATAAGTTAAAPSTANPNACPF